MIIVRRIDTKSFAPLFKNLAPAKNRDLRAMRIIYTLLPNMDKTALDSARIASGKLERTGLINEPMDYRETPVKRVLKDRQIRFYQM